MQSLTLKVGDLMLQTESIRDKDVGKKSKDNISTFKFGEKFFASVTRFFCSVYLKLNLKDVGSSIRCEGKVQLTGTKNIKIGNSCKISKNVHLHTEGRGYIHLGINVHIGTGVKIISNYNITIEDNTHIGDNVIIKDSIGSNLKESNGGGSKPVYIGKDTWIGKGTRIHAGVTLGHHSTITPRSVVTRSIPPEVIAGGTPAKIIADR